MGDFNCNFSNSFLLEDVKEWNGLLNRVVMKYHNLGHYNSSTFSHHSKGENRGVNCNKNRSCKIVQTSFHKCRKASDQRVVPLTTEKTELNQVCMSSEVSVLTWSQLLKGRLDVRFKGNFATAYL